MAFKSLRVACVKLKYVLNELRYVVNQVNIRKRVASLHCKVTKRSPVKKSKLIISIPKHFKIPSKLQRIEDRLKEDTEREFRTLRDGLRLLNNQLDKVGVKSCTKLPFKA